MKKLLIVLYLFSSVISYSQDYQYMDQIKSFIGDTIDAKEREFFDLFSNTNGFTNAIPIQRTDEYLDFMAYTEIKDSLYKKLCTQKYFLEVLENAKRKRELDALNLDDGPVTILLDNGESITGELLSANGLELHFNEEESSISERETFSSDRIISKNEIRKIIIRGESHILGGMLIGLGSGVLLGAIILAIEESSGNDNGNGFAIRLSFTETAPFACTLIGAIGAIIGAIIGALAKEDDLIIDVTRSYDFSELQKYCSLK